MANSKHAHLRYNILDECFRNKSYSFEQLLGILNKGISELYPGEEISERTLREDIKLFRNKVNGFNAPLLKGKRTYSYADANFTIAQRPLLKYEQYLIEAAQQLLSRFENHPKYNKLAEALFKFQDEEEQENDTRKILFYDHNEEYKGIEFLKPFYLAIKKKQVLQIKYKGFKENIASVFEFHPHLLKQYNRRWFVFGFNKTRDTSAWSIPLDERLLGFEILEDKDYIESNANWEGFFRSIVGVVKPDEARVEKVVLRFHNGRENYFKTKPFIPDYDFYDEHSGEVFFETIINLELIQQILSYGKDVEVLEPEVLRKEIKNQISIINKYYQ